MRSGCGESCTGIVIKMGAYKSASFYQVFTVRVKPHIFLYKMFENGKRNEEKK